MRPHPLHVQDTGNRRLPRSLKRNGCSSFWPCWCLKEELPALGRLSAEGSGCPGQPGWHEDLELTCDLHGLVHNILCAAVNDCLCPALHCMQSQLRAHPHETRHRTCSAQQRRDRQRKLTTQASLLQVLKAAPEQLHIGALLACKAARV